MGSQDRETKNTLIREGIEILTVRQSLSGRPHLAKSRRIICYRHFVLTRLVGSTREESGLETR
jgi:hypothetical protein